MTEYYINNGTCAIIPLGEEVSRVVEIGNEFIVSKSAKDIIDDSCKYYGSSYKGRFEGSKKILKMRYKLPIVVEEYNNIIFFPTNSPRGDQSTWISLKNISNYVKDGKVSKIYFCGNSLNLEISYYCLENQIFRATMLESLIRRRKDM